MPRSLRPLSLSQCRSGVEDWVSLTRPLYIGSEIYRRSSYGPNHPLAVPRVSTVTDIIRSMGWLSDDQFHEAPVADESALARFHDRDYLSALRRAEATQRVSEDDQRRYGIGANGNPIYPEIFRRPATSAGGVMLAARLVMDGGIVHCPGGGTHHGRKDRASGFCYVNDCVLGILTWLDAGLERIAYLDIDAHHGDGVEDAFRDDSRVLTISVHEAGRWPGTGLASDTRRGILNFPVPEALCDSELRFLMETAIMPAIAAHRPQAVLLQCGADGLLEDPLAKLALSNAAHRYVARAVVGTTPRVVVVGGGGYNPWSVGRAWACVWAELNAIEIPERITPGAEAVLRALRFNRAAGRNPPEHWLTTLADAPRECEIRAEVECLAREFQV
jgi:acetoin utilization protein AcuC